MWNNISKDAFYRTFVSHIEGDAMDAANDSDSANDAYNSSDLPICCVCDTVSLERSRLPSCTHQACAKCVAMANLNFSSATSTTITCRTCIEEESLRAKNDARKRVEASKSKGADSANVDKVPKDGLEAAPGEAQRIKALDRRRKSSGDVLAREGSNNGRKEATTHAAEIQNQTRARAMSVPSITVTPAAFFDLKNSLSSCTLAESVNRIQTALAAATKYSHCADCLHLKKCTAPDQLCLECSGSYCQKCSNKHRTTLSTAEHIMVPLVPGRRNSFNRRGGASTHRPAPPSSSSSTTPSSATHAAQPPNAKVTCPRHSGAELGMFCKNCETLVCRECIVDQHLHCPEIVSSQEHAQAERDVVKMYRVKYAQVMRFFSEQRRDTEETMAALELKKRDLQSEIRKFFSVVIKAAMDVEGALLEELETSVSDQTDMLTEQSSAWLDLQENTKQLLDITDVLSFLPTPDFLPLSTASSTALGQALRLGESLAAASPPQMTLSLCLEQSSQRGVVKRIKEIGATALTVHTHNTLALRKVATTAFSASSDKEDPMVTGMLLLTQTKLLVADFNNACLKLLCRDDAKEGENWHVTEVLPLKWKPYDIVVLSVEKMASSSPQSQETDDTGPSPSQQSSPPPPPTTLDHSSGQQPAPSPETKGFQEPGSRSKNEESVRSNPRRASLERQSAVQEMEMTDEQGEKTVSSSNEAVFPVDEEEEEEEGEEAHVAVSSPSAGLFIVAVPMSPSTGGEKRKMRMVRSIREEKGFWGMVLHEERSLAVTSVDAGRSFVSLVNTDTSTKHRVPVTSNTTVSPLMSPRHLVTTGSNTILVCDTGKKAVLLISTATGQILFQYTGQANQRLLRPEGLCVDHQGHVYVADSGDNSVWVITKGGHLCSKTARQQTDLQCPQAVCVDRNSCLYVANDGGKLLSVYDIMQETAN